MSDKCDESKNPESTDLIQTKIKIWAENPHIFHSEVIARAKGGDSESGKYALSKIVSLIYQRDFDSPLFAYLADCLTQYENGLPLERAMNVEDEDSHKGGRPRKYDPDEVAALDILLRREGGLGKAASADFIKEHVGMDAKDVRTLRKAYDSEFNEYTNNPLMDGLSKDMLFHLLGSLRPRIGQHLALIYGEN